MAAVYLTIWIALGLFTAGEIGRARHPRGIGWPWHASALGLALSILHTVLAFDVVHGWSHEDAVLNTAIQTERVFGTAVGWGLYVNYVFFLVWLLDLVDWRRRAGGVERRPTAALLALQVFYLVIVLNAAVIFAAGSRRAAGAALVLLLCGAWGWQLQRSARSG
jgi:hypothetical protein